MSCSTSYPFSIVKGDTYTWTLNFTVGTTPYDISNFDFYFTAKIRKDDLDIDAVITQDWNTNSNLPNAVLGITRLNLSSVQTDIPVGNYYYDIKFKSPTNEVKTFISGIVSIEENITDR